MASKRHIRRKSCEGKRQFDTGAQANRAATAYYYNLHERMSVYHCKFCHKYHIGHPSRKMKQAMQARLENA